MKTEIIVDVQLGDCGKGKVTSALLSRNDYTHCVRYNGGHNAGHTIFHNGKKVITHAIPSGILHGVKSIIGSGCVVNANMLRKELTELELAGYVKASNLLYIDKRAHVITDDHLKKDGADTQIGTTKRGTGPAYADKYGRAGSRVGDSPDFFGFNIIDSYEEFYSGQDNKLLFEGAQGFGLDIDWGDYPYVTSSHCTVGGALNCGVYPQSIQKIYGVAKAYQTYVGAKKFQPEGDIFDKLRELGAEYGATTGRPRQVDFLNLDSMLQACRINGVTDLIINKTDILQSAETYCLYEAGEKIEFASLERFCIHVESYMRDRCATIQEVKFSFSAHDI